MFKQYYGIAALTLLLGLFPAFHLPTMQLMLVIVLISLVVSFRQLDLAAFRRIWTWRNLCFAQFYLFFLLNAVVYPVWDSPRMHYRAVAIESWSIGLFSLLASGLWLRAQSATRIRRALTTWLPVGLTVSFAIASFIYFSGVQGKRISIFTPNALGPPLWFLILTLTSFVWFFEMSRTHKIWRIALFLMAGLMVVYGSARLVMLAWGLCSVVLTVWIYTQSPRKYRLWVLLGAGSILLLGTGVVLLADALGSGHLLKRMREFGQVDFTYDSISEQFLRLKIWTAALSVIADNPLLGVGKANERLALQQEMEWDRWLRAHQTYLSYLIAGGIPALISGLIMQSPVLAFLSRARRSTFFPAFLGLGVVVTMNCLTDSIFQSAVNVQVFMVTMLIFLRASDADHPTLAPQKHVSPAIT